MKIYGRILILLLLFAATSCAPDPRKEAKAQETVMIAKQTAANMEQARQIERERADAEKLKADYQQAVWDSALGTTQTTANTLVRFVGWSLTIALSVVVLGAAWTVKETSIGIGRTFVQFAEVRAGLIHMDRGTRTFPAFVDVRQMHGTRFIAKLADGGVMRLDAAQLADRQLIAALAQVSALGVFGQEMREANDAAGMAMFQPDVIAAKDGPLVVGAEFVNMLREGANR